MIHRRWLPALLAIWFFTPVLAQSPTQKPYATLPEALSAGAQLSGSSGPRSVNWIDGGSRFSFLAGRDTIKTLGPKTLAETIVFTTGQLTFPGTDKPFAYESFRWSKDAKNIVFQANFRRVYRRSGVSDYYVYSLADKKLKLVARDAQTAELAPDGQKIGYERGGNLFVFDFATQKETQLTRDAKPAFYNGRFGWAYEEEFGLAQAWEWSPDSRMIAFWQSDERAVPIYKLTDYQGFDEKFDSLPYPRVGDKNPTVRIGVIDLATQKNTWMKVSHSESTPGESTPGESTPGESTPGESTPDDGYIPRIYWTSQPGQLAIMHLNRKQNDMRLFMADARTGAARQIMQETSKSWVDIFDFFAGIDHLLYFPAGLNEFYWVSDRDGFAHLYRYDYSGKLLGQVTRGKWEVTYVHHIDVETHRVYYTSTEAAPTERQLFVIGTDGKNKQRITTAPGRHTINMSPNGQYFIDRYSSVQTPTRVELRNTAGKLLKTLEANEAVVKYVAGHVYAPKELSSFTGSDGQRIDISIIKPLNFDPSKKYPVVLDIYGGPGAQSVYNEWAAAGWHQWLAQEGYFVVGVNNRGSGGYGRDFEKVVYEQLGKYESQDFVDAAEYMASLSYVDGDRMAIRGHSYGGYMSSYTMLTHPGVFEVSLVGAPVTDWRLYDSIYTERYMGLLPENDAKYQASAVTTYAKNLAGKLFVAHSTMDENVHVRNTFQLMTALENAGKDADLRIYPPGAHGVSYNGASYQLLYRQYTDYLNRYLKGGMAN